MIKFLFLLTFCVWASAASYTIEEYNRRVKIIQDMDSLYNEYLHASVHDPISKQALEKELEEMCDNSLDDSNYWIMEGLTATTGGLIDAVFVINNHDIGNTIDFLHTALENIETGTKIAFFCSAQKNDLDKFNQLLQFEEEVARDFPILIMDTTAYLLTVFRKEITDLVNSWLVVNKLGYNDIMTQFTQIAADALYDLYPLGPWVTIIYKNVETRKLCFRPDTFHYTASTKDGWLMTVVLLSDGQKYDEIAAEKAINRIVGNSADQCSKVMDNIIEEAQYECNSDQFTFFGIFSNAMFGASDKKLFKRKDVKTSRSCSYKICIFA